LSVQILIGDVFARLKELPADHFACVLSSPPYWGLRSYLDADHPDKAHEIGLEPTLGEHLGVPLSGVSRLVNGLSARGYVTFERNQKRSLRIVERREPGQPLEEMATADLLRLRAWIDAELNMRRRRG
jgi:hypothetical protein